MMHILELREEEAPSPKILFKASARVLVQSLKTGDPGRNLVSAHVKLALLTVDRQISNGANVT